MFKEIRRYNASRFDLHDTHIRILPPLPLYDLPCDEEEAMNIDGGDGGDDVSLAST